jgi:ribosomal protein S18 acetylase RimI-like enzyme
MRAQEFVDEDLTRRGFLRGMGAAAVAGAGGSALAQTTDVSNAFKNMRRDDPRVRHAQDINDLAKAIYQNMVAQRGQPADRREQNKWMEIAHLKAEARFAQYKPGAQTAAKTAAGFSSQGSEYRRARDIDNFESVTEAKTVEYNGLSLRIKKPTSYELRVEALDDWGNNVLGYVEFDIGDDRELDPQDLRVDDRYQGQGIAKTMYDYVKSLGYKIVRSWDQTDAGAGFWDKHRGEDVRVWEQGIAEGNAKEQAVRRIQKMLNDRFDANLDIDGVMGPLTQKSINRFMPGARPGAADDPNKTTAVQGRQQKNKDMSEEQLDELSFLGSECTKDCSGHRAGYDWSKRKGLRQANSWSPSFNKGAGLAVAGK